MRALFDSDPARTKVQQHLGFAFLADDVGAHAQQVVPRDQADNGVVAAPNDRNPAGVGRGHSVNQTADELVVVTEDQFLLGTRFPSR